MMARDGALQRGEQDAAFVGYLEALFAGHPPDARARTVEFHKYQMMEVNGLRSSVELIRFAIKHGIATI